MDVSGWTIDQLLRMPDWCFGDRQLYRLYLANASADTYKWFRQELALPAKACIWGMFIATFPTTGGTGHARFGLHNILPTSTEEMDGATPIFEDYRSAAGDQNLVNLYAGIPVTFGYSLKTGIVPAGKKLVMELYCAVATMRAEITFVISGVPTSMAGWLAHSKV